MKTISFCDSSFYKKICEYYFKKLIKFKNVKTSSLLNNK